MTPSDAKSSCDTNSITDASSSNGESSSIASEKQSLGSTVHTAWCGFMDSVRSGITTQIVKIAQNAARYPGSYVTIISLLSISLLAIGFFTRFELHVDTKEQLTAVWSRLIPQRNWLHNTFPEDPYTLRIFVNAGGDNILSLSGMDHAMEVVQAVQSTPGYQQACDAAAEARELDDTNTGGKGSLCLIQGITSFWNHSTDILQASNLTSNADIVLAVNADTYPNGGPVDDRDILSEATYHYDTAVEATAFPMAILIPSSAGEGLALDVLDTVLQLRSEWEAEEDSPFRLEAMLYDYSIAQEMVAAAFKDVPLIPLVFVIMSIFTILVFSTADKPHRNGQNETDAVCHCHQRILLGLGAVYTILLSIATSYGLLWIIGELYETSMMYEPFFFTNKISILFLSGVPFTNLTQILPFVIFGIGLDDSFIIFQEYARTTGSDKDIVERIGDIFQEVGLSIFCTSLTTAVASSLTLCSNFPMLRWCAAYAFPTVVIDSLYQITFFVALIVLDERRIDNKRQKRRHQPVGEAGSIEEQRLEELSMAQTEEIAVKSCRTNSTDSTGSDLLELESQQTSSDCALSERAPASAMDRFMKWYGNWLLKPAVKAAVILGFLALTTGLTYSAAQFKQGFNFEQLLPRESYMQGFFKALDTYGKGRGWMVPTAYFRNVDQSDPDVQLQMQAYIDELVSSLDSITEHPTYCWITHFQEFLTYDERLPEFEFKTQLDIFLSIDHFKQLYGDDIVRDPETGEIVASRCMMHMDNVDKNDVYEQVEIYKHQEAITRAIPANSNTTWTTTHAKNESGKSWNFFLYETIFYVWEFYGIFQQELSLTISLGVISVTLIGFMFLPHWTASLFLLPIISVLCVDLLGFLQLCGVVLNGMSYYCISMSIGLLVDFNMHVLLKYYESRYPTREEKVKDALQSMGSSVALGGLSTFLGVIPLVFSSSDMMKILFYAFWGMVILGCSHGLIVLPVLLSIFGPEDNVKVLEVQEVEVGIAIAIDDSIIKPNRSSAIFVET